MCDQMYRSAQEEVSSWDMGFSVLKESVLDKWGQVGHSIRNISRQTLKLLAYLISLKFSNKIVPQFYLDNS